VLDWKYNAQTSCYLLPGLSLHSRLRVGSIWNYILWRKFLLFLTSYISCLFQYTSVLVCYWIDVMFDWTILHCLKRMKQQLKFAKYHLLIIVQNSHCMSDLLTIPLNVSCWICSRDKINVAWIFNHLHELYKKRHARYTEVAFGVKSKKMYLNLTYEIYWWFSKWCLWNKTTRD